MLSCEIVITSDTSRRGQRMLRALAMNAPTDVNVLVTDQYGGRSDWLMLFGMGEPRRNRMCAEHLAKNRRIVVWDLGYWDRLNSLRVSVDHQHPWRWIYRMPVTSGRGHPAPLRDDFDPNGPTLFAGMGRKSKLQLGSAWDSLKIAELQRSGASLRIRDKPARKTNENMVPIDEALLGCSKVVTHHSNVAVDGIVAGIPHEVADGAAFALKPTRDPALRRDFLDRLGSWQWSAHEAPEIWNFLRSIPEHE